jgi:cytochrome c-L
MNTLTRRLLTGAAVVLFPIVALALDEPFRNTVTGEVLDLTQTPKEGKDTPAVKEFMETGKNPYNGVEACFPRGEFIFLSSCSGCHGHVAEGKVGPGLNDNYWTYPKNKKDKGMFETIFGGAQGMMGPHNDLQLNEILLAMAWIRHLYTGPVEGASWLTKEQKATFTPYKQPEGGEKGGDIDSAKAAPVDKCGPFAG